MLVTGTFNPLSTNLTKWSNAFKEFVGKLPTNCWSVYDHFVGLGLRGGCLTYILQVFPIISRRPYSIQWHYDGAFLQK